MWSSLLFIILSISFAEDLTCITGKISQTTFGKTNAEKSTYCFNKNKTTLASKSCLNQTCKAYQSTGKVSYKELYSEYGKPGFVLCRKLKGEPQIIYFYVDNKPYKLDRCTFSDGGFIDTGLLLEYYSN